MEAIRRMNSIIDFIKNNALNHKTRTVLIDEKCSMSNFELYEKVQTVSGELETVGIKKYHKVLIISDNSIDFFVLFFAIKLLGGIPILINTRISQKELQLVIEKSNPNFIFLEDSKIETTNRILSYSYKKTENSDIDCSLENTGVMLHTSGTSGNIKIVALSEKNLISGAIKTKENRNVTKLDVLYLILPVTFVFGLNLSLGLFYSSASIFIAKKFKRSHLRSFEKHKISMLSSTPVGLARITSIMIEANVTPSYIRYISYGGDAISEENKTYIEKFFNLKLVNGYGMTETTATISINNGTMKGVGRVIKGLELKFLLNERESENEGLVLLKGETIGQGYYVWNSGIIPYTHDGWFNTGDYGKLVDGDLILIGRYKDLFVYNGSVYNPVSIENSIEKLINKKAIIIQNQNQNYVFVKNFSHLDKDLIDNLLKEKYNIENLEYLNLLKIPLSYNGKIKRGELLRKVPQK